MLLLLLAVLSMGKEQHVPLEADISRARVYHGAYIPFGQSDITKIADFETKTGKGLAIIHWYQSWDEKNGDHTFNPTWVENVRNHGSIPMITWEPWNRSNGPDQPQYSLESIMNGAHDEYIRSWAQDIKSWGNPLFIRFAHGMNTDKYPWSESTNNNRAGQYVQAWKHVQSLFKQEEVTNVTWVWCPSQHISTVPLSTLYPGNESVDWTCVDGYNLGIGNGNTWRGFTDIFTDTYHNIMLLAGSKPMMIGEIASVEDGGSKADWIKDVYTVQVPNNFTNIKAVIWSNQNTSEYSYEVTSNPSTLESFKQSISSEFYAPNILRALTQTPIPAPTQVKTASEKK